jgi:pyruvate,water dikinase
MPEDVKADILRAWEASGKDKAYAVRSSATAEDLPTASFAGQQDTYLNIRGSVQLLKAIQNCWASLFTDRAITYRTKNNFDHRSVFLSVVVQQMVFPEVAGIMFTADPISGRRKTISIDASFGLGEALVSGLVTADLYQVRLGKITKKQVSKKKIAIYSMPEGGTETRDVPAEKQEMQALADDKMLELAELGGKIEAHYGIEQDIEWGYADGRLYILQSRPITSLYPAPRVKDDKLHVFFSFGHIQMMTDAMKPLAISLLGNIVNFIKDDPASPGNNFIYIAGSRVFADITGPLLLKPSRKMLQKVLKGMDENLAAAVSEIIKREDFLKLTLQKSHVIQAIGKLAPIIIPAFIRVQKHLHFSNPENAGKQIDALFTCIISKNENDVFKAAGADRIRLIRRNMGNIVPHVLSRAGVYWIAGVLASSSLGKKLKKKVGEKQATYLLGQLNKSLPGNVTTEMGLKIGDLADEAGKYPEVLDYLKRANSNGFYEGLAKVQGGVKFRAALEDFLKKYGMRCSGEIDVTKPRWREDPMQLIPSIISNIHTSAPGEHREKFKQGEMEALQAEKEIIAQLGEKRKIYRLVKLYRNLLGLREHHKFLVIVILDLYKRAIMEEAGKLAREGVLVQQEDVYYLTLEELAASLEKSFPGNIKELVEARKKQHILDQKLNPPRVMTSEGEIITGRRRDVDAPEGALTGTPVSAGIVEGIARVITRMEDASINPGEILVAPFTDPGWTPLFTSAVGLVTEIGGMMTHGSVIAREYGIPAVVGIENATGIIKDGDRIKVNGTEGYVQILK